MTSKKTPPTTAQPAFSAAFNHALQVLGIENGASRGVAEAQAPYAPPVLPPKKPVKDKPAS